jgi:hypothetical protein
MLYPSICLILNSISLFRSKLFTANNFSFGSEGSAFSFVSYICYNAMLKIVVHSYMEMTTKIIFDAVVALLEIR